MQLGDGRLVILGIDPGMAIMGYGVIRADGPRFSMLEHGVITTPAGMPLNERLVAVYQGVRDLVLQYKPDMAALEELFFAANTKSAIAVAQARGAAMVAASQDVPKLYEFTPMQVKKAVVGYGKADKQQVQQMVKLLLGLDQIPKPDDAADALAIALCCAQSQGLNQLYQIR